MEVKKFWENPENNPIKIILLVIVIAAASFFVFQYSQKNSLKNSGLVFDPLVSGFKTAITSPAGFTVPSGLAAGDFTSDGIGDLAIIESTNPTINILQGNGDGTFSPLTSITLPGGTTPVSITTNIFRSGSSFADIAVADSNSGEIFVFLGNGDGTFTASIPASFTAGIGASSNITSGVLGSTVAIFAAQISAAVAGGRAIFTGNGDGTFDPASPLTLTDPTGIFRLSSEDINNDGDFDLGAIHLGAPSTLTPDFGDGVGGFSTSGVSTPLAGAGVISDLVFTDFDNDGNVDLAVIGKTAGQVDIYPGNGTGAFSSGTAGLATIPGTSASSIAAADFNGDGTNDLVVSDSGTSNVYVLLNAPLPTVLNVTSSTANGSYRATSVISIQVVFDNPVIVSGGTPALGIQVASSTTRSLEYSSGSGTDTLTFLYTVNPGENTSDLDYPDINSIVLDGARIKDALTETVDANLQFSPPGTAGSLGFNKNIIIDTTAPVVTEVTPVSSQSSNPTPTYTFSSSEAGAISYAGECSSATTSATIGSNTITFSSLSSGTYSDCTISVTDLAGNISNILAITPFVISTTSTSGGGGGGHIPLPPFLTETIPVSTPTTNHNPSYTLTSNESGNLFYAGSCSSNTTFIGAGANTITFNTLPSGSHGSCTIQLTNGVGIKSNILSVSSFTIVDPVATPTIIPAPEPKPTPAPKPKPKPVPIVIPAPEPQPEPAPSPIIIEVPVPIVTPPAIEPDPIIETIPVSTTPIQSPTPESSCVYRDATGVLDVISNEVLSRFCQIKPYLIKLIDGIQNIYRENHGDTLLKILVVLSILIGGTITMMYGLFLDTLSFAELRYIPTRLLSLFGRAIGFKNQTKMWGTVYDSVTKHPLDPVSLTLWDGAGKKIASTMTDLSGKYSFGNLVPGNYTITATKHKYAIVSETIGNRDHDEVYRHLYHGESFNVLAPGGPMLLNIPMHPENFDWTAFVKDGIRAMKSYAGSERLFFGMSSFFITLGFYIAILLIIGTADVWNIVLFSIAIILFILKPQTLCARQFGYITDGRSGDPLSFGIVRISSGITGTDIVDCVLDAVGKYSFPLPKGSYRLRIDRKNFDVGYHTLIKDIPIITKKNVIAQSLIVTEAT